MTTNEFLKRFRKVRFGMNVTRPWVVCADGFKISIQAGEGMYSNPRFDAHEYTHVELGYPNREEPLIKCFYDDTGVYPFVPVEVADAMLEKHGGIASFDYSNGTEEWRTENAPTLDAAPVRHGRWLKGMMPTYGGWKCSLCNKAMVLPKPNYCPNCGAKMDGEKCDENA